MATYCISDIHGNIKALCALLKKIDFHYDGTDQLYLLGDYVDWGPNSIETLMFCMRLSAHPFVKCLMGNHDLMFYRQIVNSERGTKKNNDLNWLYNNRGFATWEQYLELSEEDQIAIEEWLGNLEYSAEVCINNKWYLLGHAGPFIPERDLDEKELERKQFEAVWYRIKGPNSDPLKQLKNFNDILWEPRSYSKFICGHSITYHYRRYENNDPYEVFFGRYFIDLDCGAKCLGLDLRQDSIPDETMMQCRLAVLCLDNMEVNYCDRAMAGYPVPGTEEDDGYADNIDSQRQD